MKKELEVILLACISLLFGSCTKSIFSNGDLTEREHTLDSTFQVVEMCDNVNVTLKHCDAQHQAGLIHIKTCENLIDNISAEIEPVEFEVTVDSNKIIIPFNKLIIRNNNTFDFLRPYDYPLEMTVYYDSIYLLIFNSNATITTDTLRGYPYWTHFKIKTDSTVFEYDSIAPNLRLEVDGGSGDFNVLTNCYRVITKYLHGTSNIILNGYTERFEIQGDYDCHGIIDGKDMEALSSYITYYGTNTVITKTFNRVTATNNNIGFIKYVRYKRHKNTWFPPDDEHPWGHYSDSLFSCPQNVERYGSNKENIVSYTP